MSHHCGTHARCGGQCRLPSWAKGKSGYYYPVRCRRRELGSFTLARPNHLLKPARRGRFRRCFAHRALSLSRNDNGTNNINSTQSRNQLAYKLTLSTTDPTRIPPSPKSSSLHAAHHRHWCALSLLPPSTEHLYRRLW